jgi:hypothetical protein
MKIIVAIPGFILFAAAVWFAIVNIIICVRGYVGRKRGDTRSYTLAPGVSLALAVVIWATGWPYFGMWVFLPAVLDPGTWILPLFPWVIFKEYISNKKAKNKED